MSKLKYFDGTNWNEVGNVAGDTLPIGAIVPYGGWNAPTGWLICNGALLNKTAYPELFNAIGYSFGGEDGGATFGLPDLRGRVPVGEKDSDSDFDGMGTTGGSKELQQHNHVLGKSAGAGSSTDWAYTVQNVQNAGSVSTENAGTGNSGNLQPYQTVNYIIKAKQSAGVVANVSNTSSNSQTDTYSCNYINDIYGFHNLYSDSTGTSGQVTLSENVSNYSYLEIYYYADGRYSSTKIPTSATQFTISLIYTGDNSYQYLFCTDCTISGNTINQNYARNNFISEQNNISSYGSTPYIKIYKVIAYK